MTILVADIARTPSPAPKGAVTPVGMKDLSALAQRLAAKDGSDPYLTSAAYHGFTGRRGLWIYEEGDDFILFGQHPNVPGKILVFPSLSSAGPTLAANLLRDYFTPADSLQLARLSPADAIDAVTRLSWQTKGYKYEVADEKVLDWLFPVHTISTAMVVERSGGAFEKFRNRLNRVDMSRIKVTPLDIAADYPELKLLTLKWAQDRATADYSAEDLFAPHDYILRMVRESGLDLQGSVLWMDGACVGYSIWEMPADKSKPASAIAFLAHGPSKGLPELLQLEMCRALQAANVGRACLGGSETPGLDTYKRKLQPVESVSLVSVDIAAAEEIAEAIRA